MERYFTICEIEPVGICCMNQELKLGSVTASRGGLGWAGVGWEALLGEGTYIYLWLTC